MKKIKIVIIVRIILISVPVIVLILILNKYFVFSGKMEIEYQVNEDSKIVTDFASKEENKLIGTSNKNKGSEYWQQISEEPVYFNLNLAKPFETVKVSFLYQNPNYQPLVKIGLKQSSGGYYLKTAGVFNRIIDSLEEEWQKHLVDQNTESDISDQMSISINDNEEETWSKISADNLVLWQKNNKNYQTIDQFLNDLPAHNEILKFNYDLEQNTRLPNYQKANDELEINQALRGSQEILTYIKDEDLSLELTFQDINRYANSDEISIVIKKGLKTVYSDTIADDGVSDSTGEISTKKTRNILLPGLTEGLYRILLSTNNDIIFRNIKTSQKYLVFTNRLYLAGSPDIFFGETFTPTELYTDGGYLKIKTDHLTGLQTVSVNGVFHEINSLYSDFTILDLSGLSRIYSPNNDLEIRTTGYFAFTQSSYFDPEQLLINELQNNSDLSTVNYIFAQNPNIKKEGDWLIGEASFDNELVYLNDDGQLEFIINLPAFPENNRILRIKEVNFLLEKEPITISNIFSRTWNYIKKLF